MTAEVAVMNRSGVALAADSAASIFTGAGTKIYNANKIFMLSKYKPVGVMIYGSAEIMHLPWETIIKIYRNNFNERSFKTLSEYGSDFISFLSNNSYLFPPDAQNEHVYRVSFTCFSKIKSRIDKTVEKEVHKGAKISTTQITRIVSRVIRSAFDLVTSRPRLSTLPAAFEKTILAKYVNIIDQAIDDLFKKHNLSLTAQKQLRRIGVGLFVNDVSGIRDQSGRRLINYSGIVIAGFGDENLYPSIVSYEVEGVVNDTVKYMEDRVGNISSSQPAAVIPFAQDEMVRSFMEGIAPDYRKALEK
jgi:hypothetical protein